MAKYLLGVDGGGTKTHCMLCTPEGKIVTALSWGTTNHELLEGGFHTLRITLLQMMESIRQQSGISWEQVEAVFGLAGVDSPAQEAMVREVLLEAGLACPHVYNDAFLGIYACARNTVGICSLNGTGTGAQGVDRHGNTYRCGGLYELSGDYAGGKILGGELIRSVYDQIYRNGPRTLLSDLLAQKLQAESEEQLFDLLLQQIARGQLESKELAPLLFQAAQRQDPTACELLRKSGECLAADIEQVIRHLDFSQEEELPIILVGSLYTKTGHSVQLQAMEQGLRKSCGQYAFRLVMMDQPPVLGALRQAARLSGQQVDTERLTVQLKECFKVLD